LAPGLTFAADLNNIRVADDIVPAPFGYESLTAKYIVAEETPIYLSPYIYPGTVNNDKLKAGQAVDALAKVKDYDWILVGKNGDRHRLHPDVTSDLRQTLRPHRSLARQSSGI
jgi:hypothetical protein